MKEDSPVSNCPLTETGVSAQESLAGITPVISLRVTLQIGQHLLQILAIHGKDM